MTFSELIGLIYSGCEEACEALAGTGVTAFLGLAALVLFIQGGVTGRAQELTGGDFGPRRIAALQVGEFKLCGG